MAHMKKFFLVIFLLLVCKANATEWFEKNKSLKIIFPEKVWVYIEKADYYDSIGQQTVADSYLRLAKRKTEEARPFNPANCQKVGRKEENLWIS